MADYFAATNRKLANPRLQCLDVGRADRHIYIPLERCEVWCAQFIMNAMLIAALVPEFRSIDARMARARLLLHAFLIRASLPYSFALCAFLLPRAHPYASARPCASACPDPPLCLCLTRLCLP